MTCWSAKRRIDEYAEKRLRGTERSRLETHLEACDSCSERLQETHSLRSVLGALPEPVAPLKLRSKLDVTASVERQAVLDRQPSRWARLWHQWRFRIDEFMRPLTIPATGGLLSSLLLFSALAFTVERTAQLTSYEVPVLNSDRMDTNLVPLELRTAVMVTLSLDGNGRITDYSVRDGSSSFVGDTARLQTNNISMPKFPSVLAFAQPISGDISIVFRPIVYRQ